MRLGPVSRALVVLVGGFLLGTFTFLLAEGLPAGGAAGAAPTTSPPPAGAPGPTSDAGREPLIIHAVGDVNPDSSYIPALELHGHAHAWSGLDGLFLEDHLTIVNLECTPSQLGEPLDKEYVFRCDPDSLAPMHSAGVEVVNLANNHSGDHGPRALLDGRDRVEEAGLAPLGVGEDDSRAAVPAMFEIRGWRVAVLGFGGVVPSLDWVAGQDRPGMADGDTIATMIEAVRSAEQQADLVIVTIHWGAERDVVPRPDDRERAEAMIEAGADAIFGHHSHRLQPLEVIDGAPVAWSLGNFVWPNLSPESSATAVARLEIGPDGRIEACLIPALITSPGRPELLADPVC